MINDIACNSLSNSYCHVVDVHLLPCSLVALFISKIKKTSIMFLQFFRFNLSFDPLIFICSHN